MISVEHPSNSQWRLPHNPPSLKAIGLQSCKCSHLTTEPVIFATTLVAMNSSFWCRLWPIRPQIYTSRITPDYCWMASTHCPADFMDNLVRHGAASIYRGNKLNHNIDTVFENDMCKSCSHFVVLSLFKIFVHPAFWMALTSSSIFLRTTSC